MSVHVSIHCLTFSVTHRPTAMNDRWLNGYADDWDWFVRLSFRKGAKKIALLCDITTSEPRTLPCHNVSHCDEPPPPVECDVIFEWPLRGLRFKLVENGALRYTTYDLLLIWQCNYSSVVPSLNYLTLNNIVTLKVGLMSLSMSMSLKMVPFESLGEVSYSHSLSEI